MNREVQYFSRLKYRIPACEIKRDYRRQGDLKPYDYILECDYENKDPYA